MAWPGEQPPWGRGQGLPGSQGWGRARTSCPSMAEWVVGFILSQSRQPWPEPHEGCAGSQLCCWCTLELLGTSSCVLHGSTRACSSADKAGLAYAVAADHGCVWDMKFCPSGAWELPTTARKVGVLLEGLPRLWGPPLVSPRAPKSMPLLKPCLPTLGTAALGLSPCVIPQHPQMSRLGLLAVAFSDGKVVLYSLPHPGALQRSKRTQVKGRKSRAAGQGRPGPPPTVPGWAACEPRGWGPSARARGSLLCRGCWAGAWPWGRPRSPDAAGPCPGQRRSARELRVVGP